MCDVDKVMWGNLIAHISVDLYQYMQQHTTLESLDVVGRNYYLELTLILMINIGHIYFQPMLNFKLKFKVGHIDCLSRK